MMTLPSPAIPLAGQILADKTAAQESAARGLENELQARVWAWASQILAAI